MDTISFQIPEEISQQILKIASEELVAILYYLEWSDTSNFALRLNEKWKKNIESIIKHIHDNILNIKLADIDTNITFQEININKQTRNHPDLSFTRIVRQSIISKIKEVLLNRNRATSAWI